MTTWKFNSPERLEKNKKRKVLSKAEKEAIRLHADEQTKILSAHDKLWRERWDRARNPFEAWADWMTPEFCAERKSIIDPWRAAVDARNAITTAEKRK